MGKSANQLFFDIENQDTKLNCLTGDECVIFARVSIFWKTRLKNSVQGASQHCNSFLKHYLFKHKKNICQKTFCAVSLNTASLNAALLNYIAQYCIAQYYMARYYFTQYYISQV